MTSYLLRSGASQSYSSAAGLSGLTPYEPPFGPKVTPTEPPASGLTPYEPPRSGLTPYEPPFGPKVTPTEPPASGLTPYEPPWGPKYASTGPGGRPVPRPSPAPLPWDGVDPMWVYASRGGLLGQAVRKSRAKIVRSTDNDDRDSNATQGMSLQRWGPQFRVNALQTELMGRFQVHGSSIFVVEPVSASVGPKAQQLTCSQVFSMQQPRGAWFAEQLDKVLRAAAEREDRLPEILSQADDTWPFFESVVGLSLGVSPHLAELLAVAQGVAVHLTMALKRGVAARRPGQCSSLVMPVVVTPGHASLPSGHATISALYSELLTALLYSGRAGFGVERAEQLDRLARRIAFNRVVAGLHFPIDSVVGYALGTQLARLMVCMAGDSNKPPAPMNDATLDAIGGPSLDLTELGGQRPARSNGSYPCSGAEGWAQLWKRTKSELAQLRV